MAALTPIRKLGSTDPLFYAERDVGALETPAQDVSDFQFFNEICRWHRDVVENADAQHFLNGVHDWMGIARAKLKINWNGSAVAPAFTVDELESYVQDGSGNVTTGSTVATVNEIANGEMQVDLARNMINTNYRGFCATRGFKYATSLAPPAYRWRRARCWIYSITDANTFILRRKEWNANDYSSAGLARGHCILHIFAG